MIGLYRSGACSECGNEDAQVACRYCGGRCCRACAHDRICVRCVRRAFTVLRDVVGSRAHVAAQRAVPKVGRRLFAPSLFGMGLLAGMWLTNVAFPTSKSANSTAAAALAPRLAPASPVPFGPQRASAAAGPFLRPPTPIGGAQDACITPIRHLAEQGPPTADPRELLARAEHLRRAGLDLRVVHVATSAADVGRWAGAPPFPARVVPLRCAGNDVLGLRIASIEPGSGAEEIGLEIDDVIIAVNGYPFDRPEAVERAYTAATRAGAVVVEIVRGARPMVISVEWPST